MKKIIAVVSGLLILTAANLLAAENYQMTVKLQEFSRPDGMPVNLKEDPLSDPAELGKLTAGEMLFLHRISMSADKAIQEEIQIGKTEAKVSYALREASGDIISVTVAIELSKTVAVENGVPVKSANSLNTMFACRLGQEKSISAGEAAGGRVRLLTIIVTK